MKILNVIKEYLKKNWIRFIGAVIYGVLIIILYNSLNDSFSNTTYYSNGCAIGGASLIAYSLLCVVNFFGGLDIFSFMFMAKRIDGKKETLYDYKERKYSERKPYALSFISYLIVGIIYVIISIILLP